MIRLMNFLPFTFGFGWLALLAIASVAVWLWGLIDCLASDLNTDDKLIWVLIIVFFNVIGSIVYLVVKSGSKTNLKVKKGKKLHRSSKDRIIAGVCGGIAEYLGADPTIIRLAWVLGTIFLNGSGVLAYIIAWIIMPEK